MNNDVTGCCHLLDTYCISGTVHYTFITIYRHYLILMLNSNFIKRDYCCTHFADNVTEVQKD